MIGMEGLRVVLWVCFDFGFVISVKFGRSRWMVRFVLLGFKCEDGFEFRGRSAVVEKSVHSSLPFKKNWNEVKDALRVPVRF